jgi:hypothetical protein
VTLAVITLALALALALSGCVSADPAVTPQPQVSAKPLFASDAEALKAAEEAYAAYLKVSDQILADGGANPERILTVATKGWSEIQTVGFEDAKAKGWKSSGQTSFDGATLQANNSLAPRGQATVSIYLCVDVSAVSVADSFGMSVVSDIRPSRAPFEISFDSDDRESRLLVAREDPWSGDDIC